MVDKIAIAQEKSYSFEGYFDIKHAYSFTKSFLSDSRHYDVSEKEYEEKNDSGSRKIASKWEAEQEYNDYYKVIIKMQITLDGKEMGVEVNGVTKTLCKGKVKLVMNAYVEPDFLGQKPKGPLSQFLDKIYEKFFGGSSEFEKCAGSVSSDLDGLVERLKQSLII